MPIDSAFRTLRLSEGTIVQKNIFATKAHLIHNNTIFLMAIKPEADIAFIQPKTKEKEAF